MLKLALRTPVTIDDRAYFTVQLPFLSHNQYSQSTVLSEYVGPSVNVLEKNVIH